MKSNSVIFVLCITVQLLLSAPVLIEGNAITINRPENCHPEPKNLENVYIIGYGSLLNTKSKGDTYPDTGVNIPVIVRNFARKWNCQGAPVGQSTTYLGVDAEAGKAFNGVVFKIPNHESLAEFDKREIFYCRQEVDVNDIKFLIDKGFNENVTRDWPVDGAQFWIYKVMPQFHAFPSRRWPIVQTYVDVFVAGCMEMQKTYNLTGYQDQCFTSTEGWEYPWVNDRLIPRRPFVHSPQAMKIDRLIDKHLPSVFKNVYIEQEILYNYPGPGNGSYGKSSGTRNGNGLSSHGVLVMMIWSVVKSVL